MTLSNIFQEINHTHTMIPKDTLYKQIKKTDFNKIQNDINLLERIFINDDVLTEQSFINELKNITTSLINKLGHIGRWIITFIKDLKSNLREDFFNLLKQKSAIEILKYVGGWLLKRLLDGASIYRLGHKVIGQRIFGTLAKTKPILALRNWLQDNIQDKIDEITIPNIKNKKIVNIINNKYNSNITESLVDPTVLKYILTSDSIIKNSSMITLRAFIGAGLAFISWKTWNLMVFKGDIIYDYDFSQALDAITGNFNLADWFLDDNGGFETLIWLISGELGVGSIAPTHDITIKLAVIITCIMVWKKKFPSKWRKITSIKFIKFINESYRESNNKFKKYFKTLKDGFETNPILFFKKIGLLKKATI